MMTMKMALLMATHLVNINEKLRQSYSTKNAFQVHKVWQMSSFVAKYWIKFVKPKWSKSTKLAKIYPNFNVEKLAVKKTNYHTVVQKSTKTMNHSFFEVYRGAPRCLRCMTGPKSCKETGKGCKLWRSFFCVCPP